MKTQFAIAAVAGLIGCGGGGAVRPATPEIVIGSHGSVTAAAPPPVRRALPLERIAIVGGSVSAGLGGTPFRDAFARAAPRSEVASFADLALVGHVEDGIRAQLADARAFHPTVIVGLDLLFLTTYGDPLRRYASKHVLGGNVLRSALDALDDATVDGAWLVIGDIPWVTTAAPWMLAPEAVPPRDEVAAANDTIRAWAASRARVVVVPFSRWTKPLSTHGAVEIAPGERVAADDLVNLDGLHPTALGTWVLLDDLDRFLEDRLPDTPKSALAFARPPR